jgi:archaellum component FlaC
LKKFTLLRQQFAKLYVEREHMVVNVKRNILAGFQRKLGAQDHALKKAEWEVGRLKREVEMVRASAEDGEVDYDRIASALEEEFDPREQELEEAPRQIEWANQRLNAMMTREQTHAFQARFRRLAERLHPDLRFEQSATAANLWERAQETYAAGDAPEMEAIELLAADLPAENIEGRPVEEIESRVTRLKTANESAINEISAMRQEWPFPLAAKLPDDAWVKSQRQEYDVKTARLIQERDVLIEELNRILDTRPTGKE